MSLIFFINSFYEKSFVSPHKKQNKQNKTETKFAVKFTTYTYYNVLTSALPKFWFYLGVDPGFGPNPKNPGNSKKSEPE